ncbi:MAG: UDP-N-acetylglucosamine--N-acetylmuramyl-(pentapeptide) pyrophosphoryl-undecaprenol N-acetylglucosamine transferase [Patescibacteria group bacterium]
MNYRILLVGGGTGGHVYPLIAIIQELQKTAQEKDLNLELIVITESNKWRMEFDGLGVKFRKILTPKLRKYEGNLNLIDIFKLPITLIQSLWYLFIFMPDLVFAKGGYVSVIPSLVGRLYFTPLFIHDSDAVLKGANKFLSRFAKKIFVSFEGVMPALKNKEVILSGNPIRKNLLEGDKNTATLKFNLSLDKKTILFLGGSQGAFSINKLLIESLVQLTKDFQVIHQAGLGNFEAVREAVEKIKGEGTESYGKNIENNYRVYDFLAEEELKNAYALADIIVARAGANLIFEISALGKPAIIVPYPYSIKEHQRANAIEFAKFGAVVLEEENLKPHILIDQIERLLKPENYSAVSQKIKQFANLEAGEIIAREIISYVTG